MALVLRKAVLPKNVSLLKCIKGRTLATTANKKNASPLSVAVPRRSLRDQSRAFSLGYMKIAKAKQLPVLRTRRATTKTTRMRLCTSCPNLLSDARPKIYVPPRHFSPTRTKPFYNQHLNYSTSPLHSLCSNLLQSNTTQRTSLRSFADKPCCCGCPCPFPCGPCGCPCGCGCLPPPCNQPPRCIQYMTGYYYYPYGFWFCGPYHVSGTCCPVGPCGPCGGPCPCPCAKCCACVCPTAAAAIVGQASKPGPKCAPKSAVVPGNQINFSLPREPSKQGRSGISKYFPFNATVTPSQSQKPASEVKPLPPVMSALMCLPYSTAVRDSLDKFPSQNKTPYYIKPNINMTKTNRFSTKARSFPRFPTKPVHSTNYARSFSKLSAQAMLRSSSDEAKMKETRSFIRHKRPKKYMCDTCPPLEKPRVILSREERDRPRVEPYSFDYASVPNYKSPYPKPHSDYEFKAYES